jgi:hypothetical protein
MLRDIRHFALRGSFIANRFPSQNTLAGSFIARVEALYSSARWGRRMEVFRAANGSPETVGNGFLTSGPPEHPAEAGC